MYSVAPDILTILVIVLYLAVAILLVRKYLQTRDIGFVWLGAAVVIWPLGAALLAHGERVFIDRLLHNQPVGFFPFSLVERREMSAGFLINSLYLTQQVIGACLLLIAVFHPSRTKATATATQEPNRL